MQGFKSVAAVLNAKGSPANGAKHGKQRVRNLERRLAALNAQNLLKNVSLEQKDYQPIAKTGI